MLHQLGKKMVANRNVAVQVLIDKMRGTRVEKDGESSLSVLRNIVLQVSGDS